MTDLFTEPASGPTTGAPASDPGAGGRPDRQASARIVLEGHIIDSLLLAKVLDLVLGSGGDYELLDVAIGKTSRDPSRAEIEIRASSETELAALLSRLHEHGAAPVVENDAALAPAPADGVLPEDFYSTTNLPTFVRVRGSWIPVDRPEMDCAIVVFDEAIGRDDTAGASDAPTDAGRARAVVTPMHRVRAGDRVVVGRAGVRVEAARRNEGRSAFEFMNSDVSSEKPKRLVVARVADRIRRAHASPPPSGGRVVVVAGPAVVHTGAAPELARLVRHGHVDVLLAGNGFATHDIESNLFGTSLGVALGEGGRVEHGHANHLRAINTIRRAGSIARAVETGVLRSGVMYECVVHQVPFLLAGSLRDDGPLPDVVTDTVVAADRMRELVSGARVAVMLASTLHAIATGNVLPADVETFCVDINPAVVTKLTDRGSHQATGIVTDTGLFLRALADELIGTEADR